MEGNVYLNKEGLSRLTIPEVDMFQFQTYMKHYCYKRQNNSVLFLTKSGNQAFRKTTKTFFNKMVHKNKDFK